MAAVEQPMAAHRMRDIRCNNKHSVTPSAWRHLQPKSRPPLRKEQKKKKKKQTHTREKVDYLQTLIALRIKHTELKLTSALEFCRSPLHFPPFFFSLFQDSSYVCTFRRWLIEGFACFNASCSCAKHEIYVLKLLFVEKCAPLGNFLNGFYRRLARLELLM